jgi:hypothetical protein
LSSRTWIAPSPSSASKSTYFPWDVGTWRPIKRSGCPSTEGSVSMRSSRRFSLGIPVGSSLWIPSVVKAPESDVERGMGSLPGRRQTACLGRYRLPPTTKRSCVQSSAGDHRMCLCLSLDASWSVAGMHDSLGDGTDFRLVRLPRRVFLDPGLAGESLTTRPRPLSGRCRCRCRSLA